MLYESFWRNKWLTATAKTIDDMIEGLEAAALELRAMRDRGVTLDADVSTRDDFARLVTEDQAVAEEFGFEPPEYDEEEEYEANLEAVEAELLTAASEGPSR